MNVGKKVNENPCQTRFNYIEDRMYKQEKKIETIMNEIKPLQNVCFQVHNFGNKS